MNSFYSVIDIIVLGCGLYCLYSAYKMKTKGDISSTILFSNTADAVKCKDKAGYIAYIFPKMALFGAVTTIYGITGLVNSYVMNLGLGQLIVMAVFFVVLIWFAVETKRAYRKFF